MKNKVQLITYAQRLGRGTFTQLQQLLQSKMADQFSGVHILPFFYPVDGEDCGFDPIDHSSVDSRLGNWSDIAVLSQSCDVMADLIVNHISAESEEFKDFQQRGEASQYKKLFLSYGCIFPDGAKESELTAIYRPRPGLPFTTYSFADGKKRMMWTTFTSRQIDINVNSEQGKQYLEHVLDTFARSGVSIVRLDAVGYAIKKAGKSCFMIPETFHFIEKLKKEAHARNIIVLLEIHSHYQMQIDIAQKVDLVYDFCLPPLLLHAFAARDPQPLKQWLDIAPRNAVTVLDTHDGIGIIDVGPSSAMKGLLNEKQIDSLIESMHKNCNGESLKSTGAVASNLDLYQINATYYSALGCDDRAYLLARLLQFFAPGIPQVYYVGYFCGKNDMGRLHSTGVGREINRHFFSNADIDAAMNLSTQKVLRRIIDFRNKHPAFGDEELTLAALQKKESSEGSLLFGGTFSIAVKNTSVTMRRSCQHHYAETEVNFSDKSFTLKWSGANGETMIENFEELLSQKFQIANAN